MKLLLLGNGFDLNHKFPTSYIDFLNTVNYLIDADKSTIATIEDVFGNEDLQEKCKNIKDAYEVHARVYDEISLEKEEIEQMVEKARNNYWFKYLSESIAEKQTWIDFEKEIVRVLEAFENFFESESFRWSNKQIIFDFSDYKNSENKVIIKSFPFFFEKKEYETGFKTDIIELSEHYLEEKIKGSGTLHLCQDKIAADLYESLRELADLLKQYLRLFVDIPIRKYADMEIKPRFASLTSADQVYSLNYTSTYEVLYRPNIVEHIHGNTNENIVLGVNPDDKDEVHSLDTTFLQFKKYFQRTFYSTDVDFLRKVHRQVCVKTMEGNDLFVVGHSLDVTDKDIINLVFEVADRIYVFYHDKTAVKNHIKNLVEIYGKEGLDRLRIEKHLVFLPQSEVDWIYPGKE